MRTRHVVTCFLEREGRVLLLRRSQRVSTYRDKWAAVSGSVETIPVEAAWSELREETGLGPADLDLLATGEPLEVTDGGTRWIVHPFRFRITGTGRLRLNWEPAASC